MNNKFKREFEKEFNKQENYDKIISKVEETDAKNSFKYRYALVTSFVLVIVLVGTMGFYNQKFSKKEANISETNVANVILNVNRIKNMATTSLDIDLQKIDAKREEIEKISDKFTFMKNIKVPESLSLKSSYMLYTRNDFEVNVYDLLHDYVFSYADEKEEKNITIAFSEVGEPLRDYYLGEGNKISKIGNTEVKISQYKDLYMATFSCNELNFDIETKGIAENELVELLVSIIE